MEAGDVNVRLTGDTSDLQSAFDDMRQRMDALASSVSGGAAESAGSLVTLGGAAVAAGTIMATVAEKVAEYAKDLVSYPLNAAIAAGQMAEQFEQLSQRIGVSVDSLQGMQVALARQGLGAESLATSFRTLSRTMVGISEGNEKAVATFQQLGITSETVGQGTGAVLYAIADRFKGMADGAEKSKLAVELFGRSGLQLIPILNQGSEGLDAAMKKAGEFGMILTKTQQNDLTVFDDAMDDLGSSLKGFQAQVGAAFAPALTSLVNAMTNAVVWAKDIFNQFADAGEKLTIRIGAMVAAFELLAKQIFSFSVLSKESWKTTIDQVKAIDKWAETQIKGVDAARLLTGSIGDQAAANLKASESTKTYELHQEKLGEAIVKATQIEQNQMAERGKHQEFLGRMIIETYQLQEKMRKDDSKHQEVLGANIVKATQIELKQLEDKGKHQEFLGRMIVENYQLQEKMATDNAAHQQVIGANIVRATQIEYAERLEASRKFFAEQFEQEEEAARLRYKGGPQGVYMSYEQQQEAAGKAELAESVAAQTAAEAWIKAYDEIENASMQRFLAEMRAADQLQETLGRMAVARATAEYKAQQASEKSSNAFLKSSTYAFGQIRSQFSNAIVDMIQGMDSWANFWKSTERLILSSFVQFGINIVAENLLIEGKKIAAALFSEQARTAIATSGSAERVAVSAAEATAQTSIWAGAAAALGGFYAAVAAGFVAITETLVGIMTAVGTAIMGVLEAIGTALGFTGVGAVWAGAIIAGAAAIGIALLALNAIEFAEGGVVTKPTLGLVGEAGPEAIIPLSQMGRMGGPTTIIVELNGKAILKHVANNLPSMLRLKGLPA